MPIESDHADSRPSYEFIFLGTGTSSSLPHIECLTAPPDDPPCKTCLSTLQPEGKKNIRRNTSALLRVRRQERDDATIVIDVGKNFQAAALEWFPKYGLRKIDAVLITHAHADAMNGLDDLRGWTLNGCIQPHVDIYCSQTTFVEVQRAFPYLVAKEFASGGGDVPEFRWHIIDDRVPFVVGETGVKITPFAVHHGRIFSKSPPPGNLPTPSYSGPSTPIFGRSSPLPPLAHDQISHIQVSAAAPKVNPLLCFGFKVEEAIIYISDASYIPEDVWSTVLKPRSQTDAIPVFVVDCLRLTPHTSHFGLQQAVACVRRLGARRSYLTGFGHEISHEEYTEILSVIENRETRCLTNSSENVLAGLKLIGEGRAQFVRPAYDGLRLHVSALGDVKNDDDDDN